MFGATAPFAQAGTPPATVTRAAAPFNAEFMRATKLIGKPVRGADGTSIGDLKDLLVDLTRGEVRYAIFGYDPGAFKPEKVYAVPINELILASDGRSLSHANLSRDTIDDAGIAKNEWPLALKRRGAIDIAPEGAMSGQGPLWRASELVGKDVSGRDGKDIGDIKELVIDMKSGKVRYAVLAFGPGWARPDRLFAFPLESFKPEPGKDELMLAIDRERLASMKSFDPKQWHTADDLRVVQVNRAR
jgi:sporulation protein YlmC with PRC-barrel domain